jgi:hypothetical protein
VSDSDEPKVLKASAPGARIETGMEVASMDGEVLGKVKHVGAEEFLLDRPWARDLWIPLSAVLATEDYTGNFRGPVQPTRVVLEVTAANLEQQGWRHS